MTLTDRGCDFWGFSLKLHFVTLVERAHQPDPYRAAALALWLFGGRNHRRIPGRGGGHALDVETTVRGGCARLHSRDKWTRGFDGNLCDGSFLQAATVSTPAEAAQALALSKNDIPYGCRLEDGAVGKMKVVRTRFGEPISNPRELQCKFHA
ncbi:MAG: hypothetical protein IJW40_00110 [Clostridia bacterium]|nr:hypothetical protein [Clostridia bacterium]